MPNRFTVGDKVLIKRANGRTPKSLLESLRLDHPRTITAVFYDPKTQHTRYYLGSNKRGDTDFSHTTFRAQELQLWVKGRIGRPKTKRRYIRRSSVSQGISCTIQQAPCIPFTLLTIG